MSTSNLRFGAGVTREVGMDLEDLGVKRALLLIDPLAAEALVNPNTAAKAYRDLEALGVVEGSNGRGVFVTEAGPGIARGLREKAEQQKRTRKTTRIQKAVVGMSIEEIRRKKAESREDRDKNADAAAKEIKERKAKQMQQKKVAAAKSQGGKGGKKNDPAVKNVKAQKVRK